LVGKPNSPKGTVVIYGDTPGENLHAAQRF
jgi:hypothetical protein